MSDRLTDLGMGLIATVVALVLPPVFMMIIFTPFAFAFIGAAILPLVHVVMLISVFAILVRGAYTGRPWFAAAPFVFVALWTTVAVATRAYVFIAAPNEFYQREIPERAKGQRTLILPRDFDPMLLANGSVDTIITHQSDSTATRPVRIKEFTLGRGDACPLDPTYHTRKLWASGRMDECILETPLQELPADGLEIRSGYDQCSKSSRRCRVKQFILWQNGQSEVIGIWYAGSARVLSYFPILNVFGSNHRITVWETNWNGPLERVYLGLESDTDPTIPALKGLDPSRAGADFESPPPRVLLDQAYRRLPEAGKSRDLRDGLRQIAVLAKERGLVDKRSLAIMATWAGDRPIGVQGDPVAIFAQGISPANQNLFREEILRFLADENNADGYFGNDDLSNLPGQISESLTERLLSIFSTKGLAAWQYEVVARIFREEVRRKMFRAGALKQQTFEQNERDIATLQQELFKQIEDSEPGDVGPRIYAYCSVYGAMPRPGLPDRQKRFISQKLKHITERQLDRILFGHCLESNTPELRNEIYGRIERRLVSITDVDLRRNIVRKLFRYEPNDVEG